MVPTGNADGASGLRSRCERSQNIPAPAKIRISGQYFPTTGQGSKFGNSRESRINPPNAISSTGNTIEPLRTPRSFDITDLSPFSTQNPPKCSTLTLECRPTRSVRFCYHNHPAKPSVAAAGRHRGGGGGGHLLSPP